MKILHATPGMGKPMGPSEVDNFLDSKLNVQIATIDEKGDPNIQPVWFYYNRQAQKMYVETSKVSKKVQNIKKRSTVYFSVDDENLPYKGVKGKSDARISEDPQKNLPIAEKIMVKYLGSAEHPMAKTLLDNVKNGNSVLIELTPRFFSTWDFSKM